MKMSLFTYSYVALIVLSIIQEAGKLLFLFDLMKQKRKSVIGPIC